MQKQRGMYIHPAVMSVLVAVISVMLTVLVMNNPLVAAGSTPDAATAEFANSGGLQLYYSTMHPWIVQDRPGTCPICGMELVPMPPDEQAKYLVNHPEFS